MSERGFLGSVIVRVGEAAQFFATRDSARRLIAERIESLPSREAVILDWTGVQAITGAFASEFVARTLATPRKIGSQGMNADVQAAFELACERHEAAS